MATKEKCALCGLESAGLPRRQKAELGVSCERCGDYYIDDLLVECGEPLNEEGKAILSGYSKWEKVVGNPPPEIHAQNIDEIIASHKNYSTSEKVDLLLHYYSIKNPEQGSSIPYDIKLEYPITYSKGDSEFWYLLLEESQETREYIEIISKDSIKITPNGWKRIEWLERVRLASEKFDLESRKVNFEIEKEVLNLKEKSHINGLRYSSVLARKIKDLFLEGSKRKIEKKLEIDRRIIFGVEVVSNTDEINFLSNQIKDYAEFEKNFLSKALKEAYEECHAQRYFETDEEKFLVDIDKKLKEIIVDLRTEGLQKKESKPSDLPEIDITELIKMDESNILEFKSTFQWDVELGHQNKELRKEVIRNIAAFNNTEGGYIIIGVADNKDIYGLEKDYSLFKSSNKRDKFLQTLSNVIENKISRDFATKIRVDFYKLEEKEVCRVKVNFGDEDVWVKENNGKEVFYIRVQNSTIALSPKESAQYIKKRW